MTRLAWFTPLPPVRSGIAAYNAELLPLLAGEYDIDVFVHQPPGLAEPIEPLRVLDAHEFVVRHRLGPYDLIVYQLGNATCHDYMWPYLMRYPGLVVLHDAQLHHSRARALLQRGRLQDYRSELACNHPGIDPGVAEMVSSGLGGMLYYLWPMLRGVMHAARAVAVHNGLLARDLGAEHPGVPIEPIRMGVADTLAQGSSVVIPELEGSPVLAAFGMVTPEKRIPQVLRAFAPLLGVAPSARLLLVGATTDYYDVWADCAEFGVADRVTITGFVADHDLPAYIQASDVCLCLRWPTGRETSGAWLRCLAAGRPTVITDLQQLVDVASLDPRNWNVLHAADATVGAIRYESNQAVTVSIDLLDEVHSLRLALQRLAVDGDLRTMLGANARAHWEREHTLAAMVADYRRVIDQTLRLPAEPLLASTLPPHLRADGSELGRALSARVGVPWPLS